VPDRVKPSFVIFDIRTLWRSVWHRMLYSCTHMATVGLKGLRHYNLVLSPRGRDSGLQVVRETHSSWDPQWAMCWRASPRYRQVSSTEAWSTSLHSPTHTKVWSASQQYIVDEMDQLRRDWTASTLITRAHAADTSTAMLTWQMLTTAIAPRSHHFTGRARFTQTYQLFLDDTTISVRNGTEELWKSRVLAINASSHKFHTRQIKSTWRISNFSYQRNIISKSHVFRLTSILNNYRTFTSFLGEFSSCRNWI